MASRKLEVPAQHVDTLLYVVDFFKEDVSECHFWSTFPRCSPLVGYVFD